MIISSRKPAWINVLILLVSATVWMMLLLSPESIMVIAHCPVTDSGVSPASFEMMLAMNPISSLVTGWALMLIAMMSPMLTAPIHHIRECSFKHRRLRSVTLFIIGYAAIWMVTGIALLAATLVLNLVVPRSYLPGVLVGIMAFVWQCSPIKQRCLNRHHNHRALTAFGFTADLDALHFGITHGFWCVGSCWLLMLFPMLLSRGHFAAMAVVTYLMISERFEHPRALNWQLRFSGKLLRIVFAQARIRLKSLRSSLKLYSSVGLDR